MTDSPKMNSMDFEDRLKMGKDKEKQIIDILNDVQPWDLEWKESSEDEDINDKVDVWATKFPYIRKFPAQIKYRDSGMDLGVALLRPWWGIVKFRKDYENDQLKYDRDYTTGIELYVCLAGDKLLMAHCDSVHEICQRALFSLHETGILRGDDWDLKIVDDATSGQRKLICYIPFNTLILMGAYYRVLN